MAIDTPRHASTASRHPSKTVMVAECFSSSPANLQPTHFGNEECIHAPRLEGAAAGMQSFDQQHGRPWHLSLFSHLAILNTARVCLSHTVCLYRVVGSHQQQCCRRQIICGDLSFLSSHSYLLPLLSMLSLTNTFRPTSSTNSTFTRYALVYYLLKIFIQI